MGWLCPGRTEPAVGPFTALLILAQVQPPWVVAARYLPSFLPFPGSIICNEIGATRNSNKSKSNSRRSMISSLRLKSGRQKAFLSLPGYVGSSVMGPSLSLGRSILSSFPLPQHAFSGTQLYFGLCPAVLCLAPPLPWTSGRRSPGHVSIAERCPLCSMALVALSTCVGSRNTKAPPAQAGRSGQGCCAEPAESHSGLPPRTMFLSPL